MINGLAQISIKRAKLQYFYEKWTYQQLNLTYCQSAVYHTELNESTVVNICYKKVKINVSSICIFPICMRLVALEIYKRNFSSKVNNQKVN